jgi:hypothetical protein
MAGVERDDGQYVGKGIMRWLNSPEATMCRSGLAPARNPRHTGGDLILEGCAQAYQRIRVYNAPGPIREIIDMIINENVPEIR